MWGPRALGAGPMTQYAGPAGRYQGSRSTTCFAPRRRQTTTLVHSPAGTELAGGWVRVRWDGMSFSIHLLVDPDAWRILAFSLTGESGEGAARLSGMLESALGEYVVGGVPLPRAVAHIVDAASGGAGGRRRCLDGWMAGPEREHTPGKA